MKEVLEHLVGDLGVSKFIAAFIFALIGVSISLLLSSNKAAAKAEAFHLTFADVWGKYVSRFLRSAAKTILIVFVSIRFAKELVGIEFSMVYSLLVGLFLDRIVAIIKGKKATFLPKEDTQP